jgi:hypothetical protein
MSGPEACDSYSGSGRRIPSACRQPQGFRHARQQMCRGGRPPEFSKRTGSTFLPSALGISCYRFRFLPLPSCVSLCKAAKSAPVYSWPWHIARLPSTAFTPSDSPASACSSPRRRRGNKKCCDTFSRPGCALMRRTCSLPSCHVSCSRIAAAGAAAAPRSPRAARRQHLLRRLHQRRPCQQCRLRQIQRMSRAASPRHLPGRRLAPRRAVLPAALHWPAGRAPRQPPAARAPAR